MRRAAVTALQFSSLAPFRHQPFLNTSAFVLGKMLGKTEQARFPFHKGNRACSVLLLFRNDSNELVA